MLIERRELLKMLGAAAGAASLGGCGRKWSVPDRLVDLALRGPGLESSRQTICGLCEGGCGLSVRLVDALPVGVKGNPHHPLNRGGVCPVGMSALEVLYSPDRLQSPLRRGADGKLEEVTWEIALDEIAGAMRSLRESGRGAGVALLSGEEDRLFHELAEQFVRCQGSTDFARVQTESTVPFRLTQGIDQIPGYDLSRADMVLSFGLEIYEDGATPIHAIASTVGSRSVDGRAALIYVGSRMSPTAAKAEIQAVVRPGTLAAFALGVGHVLVREGRYDKSFVDDHTFGFDDWQDDDGESRLGFRRLLLEQYYPDRAAQLCGCEPELIVRVARRFAAAAAPVAVTGGPPSQGTNGTFTTMAVHALNALVGVFDKPGGVTLPPIVPLTSMPSVANGPGDDAGGVFSSIPGSTAVAADPVEALVESVQRGEQPELLFVVGSNPVHDSPAGNLFRETMASIPKVVVLASFLDDTAANADYVLPTSTFLESWRAATTPAGVDFSVLGVGQPVVEPLYDTRHPADVLLELGRRAGPESSDALPWADYTDYIKYRLEGLAESGQGSIATGSFEDSWVRFLEERGWRFLAHEGIEGFWSSLERESVWWNPVQTRGDWSRHFQTPSGRFEFFSQALENHLLSLAMQEESEDASRKELIERAVTSLGLEASADEVCLPHFEPAEALEVGELRLQPFRPITARGGLGVLSPMVLEMFGYSQISGWRTYVELAPDVAKDLALHSGDVVSVETGTGSLVAVVRVMPGCDETSVHIPLGLGHPPLFGMTERVGENPVSLMTPARDPIGGRLSMASTGVHLRLLRRGRVGGPVSAHGGAAS